MNYKEYLRSEHWIEFRVEIYSKRKFCQNCGSNNKLNIHHKHYESLGKEKNSDIIVLCNKCHFKLHDKKKWSKRKQAGLSMDFTAAAHQERDIFNIESILRRCDRCGENHPIFYKSFPDMTRLGMACPNSKPRIRYLKYEEGLPIPFISRI